jgi:uncharacterized damage-inducible protein DinB
MTRQLPARNGDERDLLNEFLDWHRATVRVKCEGVTDADARRAPLPSSPLMTIAGLVNHLRWVEHDFFEVDLDGQPSRAPWSREDPNADMRVDGFLLAQLLDEYDVQCARSRKIVAGMALDDHERNTPPGAEPASLRWIMLHMIEETARHNGHLDAIRELVDGVTGE